MSTPLWFLGKYDKPARDGHPSFREALEQMPPIADSCYRPRPSEPAPQTPEPGAQSQD